MTIIQMFKMGQSRWAGHVVRTDPAEHLLFITKMGEKEERSKLHEGESRDTAIRNWRTTEKTVRGL